MEISWWKQKWWYSLPTSWHIMASREIPEANGGVHREIIKLNGDFPARLDCRRVEGIASCTPLLKVKTMVSRMGSTLNRLLNETIDKELIYSKIRDTTNIQKRKKGFHGQEGSLNQRNTTEPGCVWSPSWSNSRYPQHSSHMEGPYHSKNDRHLDVPK